MPLMAFPYSALKAPLTTFISSKALFEMFIAKPLVKKGLATDTPST